QSCWSAGECRRPVARAGILPCASSAPGAGIPPPVRVVSRAGFCASCERLAGPVPHGGEDRKLGVRGLPRQELETVVGRQVYLPPASAESRQEPPHQPPARLARTLEAGVAAVAAA